MNLKHRLHTETSRERVCLINRWRLDDQRICQPQRVERLPEPTRRQRTRVGDILDPEHDEIHIPMQCEVLKAVVEQVHRGPKLRFGQPTGEIPVLADKNRRPRKRTGQHERLVAGFSHVRPHGRPITNHDDAVGRVLATIASG